MRERERLQRFRVLAHHLVELGLFARCFGGEEKIFAPNRVFVRGEQLPRRVLEITAHAGGNAEILRDHRDEMAVPGTLSESQRVSGELLCAVEVPALPIRNCHEVHGVSNSSFVTETLRNSERGRETIERRVHL